MSKSELTGCEPGILKGKIITFRVKNICYAIDASYVREVICSAMVTLVKADDVSPYCHMINYRGGLVRAFDMQLLTGQQRIGAAAVPNVMMVEQKNGGSMMAGLIVDSVEEVIHSDGQEWSKAKVSNGYGENKLIKAEFIKGGRSIYLLDPEYLFEPEFVHRISKISNAE